MTASRFGWGQSSCVTPELLAIGYALSSRVAPQREGTTIPRSPTKIEASTKASSSSSFSGWYHLRDRKVYNLHSLGWASADDSSNLPTDRPTVRPGPESKQRERARII